MAGPLDRVVGMRQALGDGHETSEEEEDLFNFEHLETKATARVSHVLIFKVSHSEFTTALLLIVAGKNLASFNAR